MPRMKPQPMLPKREPEALVDCQFHSLRALVGRCAHEMVNAAALEAKYFDTIQMLAEELGHNPAPERRAAIVAELVQKCAKGIDANARALQSIEPLRYGARRAALDGPRVVVSVGKVIHMLCRSIDEKSETLDFTQQGFVDEVMGHWGLVGDIFAPLLLNAVDAGASLKMRCTVRILSYPDKRQVCVQITDPSSTLTPPEFRELTQHVGLVHGRRGLRTCCDILAAYGGTLLATSLIPQGVVFAVTLPTGESASNPA